MTHQWRVLWFGLSLLASIAIGSWLGIWLRPLIQGGL
jgi:hypothetical protein